MIQLEKCIKVGVLFSLSFIFFGSSACAEPLKDSLKSLPNSQMSEKKYPIQEPEVSEEAEKSQVPEVSSEISEQNDNNESIPKPTRQRSGFIVKDIAKSGFILKSFKPDIFIENGAIIYVKKGELDELKIGQRFTIFSAKRKISPPKVVNEEFLDQEYDSFDRTTDSYYMAANDYETKLIKPIKKIFKIKEKTVGVLVKKLGTIEILEKGQFADKAIVLETFSPIKSGDRFVPKTDQKIATKRAKDIDRQTFEGIIMAFDKVGTLASRNDIIFIDKGRDNGLLVGDRLDIFVKPQKKQKRGFEFWKNKDIPMPDQIIGKIQILSTKKTTATAIIILNNREILLGQRVRYPKLASVETVSQSTEVTTNLTKP